MGDMMKQRTKKKKVGRGDSSGEKERECTKQIA
jgi:hypothetical protein